MKHFAEEWIAEWCQDNGWTDLFLERQTNYWAFPPNAVMPEPIPTKVLRQIKAEKGLSSEEQLWSASAIIATLMAIAFSYITKSPMPLVFAFAFAAVIVGRMEVEYC
jgi:hypothetical protein